VRTELPLHGAGWAVVEHERDAFRRVERKRLRANRTREAAALIPPSPESRTRS